MEIFYQTQHPQYQNPNDVHNKGSEQFLTVRDSSQCQGKNS